MDAQDPMDAPHPALEPRRLDDVCALLVGALPPELRRDEAGFEVLWNLHPADYHEVVMGGRRTPTPRWQQAYARDYTYSGSVNRARPLPAEVAPLLQWARGAIDSRLNGVLVNWYDLSKSHFIGRHKDSPVGLVEDAPIVTISFGATRTFVLERRNKKVPIEVEDGTVVVMPAEVNRRWSHQVPRRHGEGRRISVTLRAFR